MIKVKQLLVPTDFSDGSAHAMEYAMEYAEHGAHLHLVHVVEPVIYPAEMFGQAGLADASTAIENAAKEELDDWKKKYFSGDVKCTTAMLHGNPVVELLQYANAQHIDLIVIATHGRGAIDHLLVGSTTERLIRKAPCPVLAVRRRG